MLPDDQSFSLPGQVVLSLAEVPVLYGTQPERVKLRTIVLMDTETREFSFDGTPEVREDELTCERTSLLHLASNHSYRLGHRLGVERGALHGAREQVV